jgi:hypothetical protein
MRAEDGERHRAELRRQECSRQWAKDDDKLAALQRSIQVVAATTPSLIPLVAFCCCSVGFIAVFLFPGLLFSCSRYFYTPFHRLAEHGCSAVGFRGLVCVAKDASTRRRVWPIVFLLHSHAAHSRRCRSSAGSQRR